MEKSFCSHICHITVHTKSQYNIKKINESNRTSYNMTFNQVVRGSNPRCLIFHNSYKVLYMKMDVLKNKHLCH